MSRIASTRVEPSDDTLVDGTPDYMMNSVIEILKKFIIVHNGRDRKTNELLYAVDMEKIHAIERYIQRSIPEDPDDDYETFNSLIMYCRENGTHALDVFEALLAHGSNNPHVWNQMFPAANRVLQESGSKWIAVEQSGGKATLEERVGEQQQEAFNEASSHTGNESGNYLKQAWSSAFGRSPNATDAYSNAIKAIEAAAWPLICPNNDSATLGHIIGEMRANPTKWKTDVTEKHTGHAITALKDEMQLLWEGQTDRHGTANPVPVSQEAAEQAVLMSVEICSLFNRGYVKVT